MHGHSYKVEISVARPGRSGDGLADRLRRHRRRVDRAVQPLRPPQPERGARAGELDLREHRDLRLERAAAAHRAAVGGDGLGDVRQQVHVPRRMTWRRRRPGTLRFLTLNLWGDNGPWQERMALLADALGDLAPDVIGLQEVRDVPGRVPNQAAELARRFGWQHVFAPSTAWGGGHEGLADGVAVSRSARTRRSRCRTARRTEGRIILSARIDAATRAAFWVHTTHLSFREPRGASARTRCWPSTQVGGGARERQHPGGDGRLQRRPRSRRDPLARRA